MVNKVDFVIDFEEEYWEETKNDPKRMNEFMILLMESVVSNNWLIESGKKMKPVFDRFEIVNNKLVFRFEFYNVLNKEYEEIYKSKLSDEDRKNYEDWNGMWDVDKQAALSVDKD